MYKMEPIKCDMKCDQLATVRIRDTKDPYYNVVMCEKHAKIEVKFANRLGW